MRETMTSTTIEDNASPTGYRAVLEGFRALGPAKLAALGLVTVGMICMLLLLVLRGGSGTEGEGGMALLYGDLDIHEAAEMADLLDKSHIPHALNATDDAISVPADQVPAARLLLARSGLPSGGSIGDEIFDKTDGLAATPFQQDISRTRALEGELVRSIRLIEGVRNARVHLVLPHREPFAAVSDAAQASVLLELRGDRLDGEAVQAILNLVSAAVPGLKAQAIAIIDNRGHVLARAGSPVEGAGLASTADELRQAMEMRLSHEVEGMLDASLGPDKVRAEASVTLDLDQVDETDETYNPDQQVLRSQQTTSDKNQHQEAQQNTSVQNNLPNADAGKPQTGSQEDRKQETDNYEIGKTVRTLVQNTPRVKRISLAVMVDGSTTLDPKGHPLWHPRSEAEVAEISTLVKSAIGFDGKRGDVVTVVSMPFTIPDDFAPEPTTPRILGLTEPEAVRLGQTGLLALAVLAVALLVFRPMITRLMVAGPATEALTGRRLDGRGRLPAPDAMPLAVGEQETKRLAGPAGSVRADGAPGAGTMDVSHVDGRVQAQSIRRLTDLVEQYPDESLSIVRGWLSEGDKE